MKVTDAEVKSNIRVATLRQRFTDAIGSVLTEDPDLTYEEAMEALLLVAQRQFGHMRHSATAAP